jgi:hypothetical protein
MRLRGDTAPYPEAMDFPDRSEDARADLVSALEVIEDQPLATRAVAYEGLHDALARRLEAGPAGSGAPHP